MKKTLKVGFAIVAGTIVGLMAAAACKTAEDISQPIVISSVTPAPAKASRIETGLYVVGKDIEPGTYRAESTEALCVWVRKSQLGGPTEGLIDSGIGRGSHVIEVLPTDKALYVSKCGPWNKEN